MDSPTYMFYNGKSRYIFFGSIISISMILAVTTSSPAFSSGDAYNSGYDHGCNDADFRYPGDRYINQPGKGPSQHSDRFMNGYEDGFNACNDRGYEISTDFPELDEGESYGRCEQNNDGKLVCDIEDD